MSKVGIVIVTFNSINLIDRCLASCYGQAGAEIIIVDNASSDGTPAHIRKHFPNVRLIESAVNLGFAKGNNLGFEHVEADIILLLNPDAFLDDWSQVTSLIEVLESGSSIAIVGPQLKNLDGSHQIGDAGWRDTLLSTAGHFLFLHRLISFLPSIYLSSPRLLRAATVEVDWVCGACLLTRSSVIKSIGGLDEKIFMYGEDVEWGERAKNAGLRVVYAPKVQVLHVQGGTQREGSNVFFNVKWIEHRARKWAKISRTSFNVFKTIAVSGFVLRWIIFKIQSAVRASSYGSTKATVMWRYVRTLAAWHFKDMVR